MPYAELQTTTNYSFLRGASHPEELVQRAHELGYAALGIADRNTLAGVVRAHAAAKQVGLQILVGARLDFADDTPSLLVYPSDRAAYARLSRLLTLGKRRAEKGECLLYFSDLPEFLLGQNVIVLTDFGPAISKLQQITQEQLWIAAQFCYDAQDAQHIHVIARLAQAHNLKMVATNDVHAHVRSRRPLQDVLSCIREHRTLQNAGFVLHQNAERYLKPVSEMTRLFENYPEAIENTIDFSQRCQFSLDSLRYEYPDACIPAGKTAQVYLCELTWQGAKKRYPEGISEKVKQQLNYELGLIEQLSYAHYFLTVNDIVSFARSRKILCQGRGSAANSVVCYCLSITAVDPTRVDLLFERFISPDRNEPPDIDVDFEHERREEVIQYLYRQYGRDKAGLAATVITYRKRSALRDVGKVLEIPVDVVESLIDSLRKRRLEEISEETVETHKLKLWIQLSKEILGFPRHLGQHVGGFVLTKGSLEELVPIGNAAMEDRTFIEWDKDDLESLGLMKVDVLGLGMLSCIRRGFELLKTHYNREVCLATVPAEDPVVYDMLCKGDTIGVFQVESRAQMSMLPRLKPRCFYDLVIEVAIVRPGPIQGNMVHPYLRRRNGLEPVSFPSKELEAVLGKTLGVPLFQEQAMRIAMVAAGFSAAEADALRRAMATFKKTGKLLQFQDRFISGMQNNGYELEFAARCYQQILGFGDYGFPESHSASFALLVYVSSWLKAHYPAVFACALLNSQPMGFYAPAQILSDAQRHGVKVLPADVNRSDWDYTLQKYDLRVGLCQVKSLKLEEAEWIVACRGQGYKSVHDLARRSGVRNQTLVALAHADAFASLGINRQQALWDIEGLESKLLPLLDRIDDYEEAALLPLLAELEEVRRDYVRLGFSLRNHPMAFVREALTRKGYVLHRELQNIASGARVKIAGMVIVRQRPPTAKGVMFQTLEDESGFANIVIWSKVCERFRTATLVSPMVIIEGVLQKQDGVVHVIAQQLRGMSFNA